MRLGREQEKNHMSNVEGLNTLQVQAMACPPQANYNAFRWGLWSWPLQEKNLGLAVFLKGRSLERQEWSFLGWEFQLNSKTSQNPEPSNLLCNYAMVYRFIVSIKTHLFRGPYMVFRGKERGAVFRR